MSGCGVKFADALRATTYVAKRKLTLRKLSAHLMQTLAVIKKDMEFNKGLFSLIEVLKNIAVSQYRAMERKIGSYEKFLLLINNFFEFIDAQKIKHPFLQPKNKLQIMVAITSDSGLLGGLNIQVVNAALRELEKIPGKLIIIGERGKIYMRESNIPFVSFGGIKDEDRYDQAIQLRDYLVNSFLSSGMGYLKIAYPHPVSFTIQRVEIVSFLPYLTASPGQPIAVDIIMESAPRDIIEYLVYLWMGEKIYEIFGLSRLAEFAARFVHLEESSQKLKEIDKKLQMQYFRIRHELIDRNMRELFSARLLYAG